MREARHFLDSNVLLYLISANAAKADRAEELIARGGCASVQVLNEFASVASRKYAVPWSNIADILGTVREVIFVVPLTIETHEKALELAPRTRYGFYDCLILASALQAGCETLYSEDLHTGHIIDGQLTLQNPFS
jgi:predicted nucleic acid-binding protein